MDRGSRLISAAGESGDAQRLTEAGAILDDLSRIEHAAMQALSCLEGDRPTEIERP
ncbi:hypothetical protein ACFXNW_18530 [Nocardia sp. NPDC059180]|uniref:hypothetical protein n=1 Tax=Nocardia sp. NPDC059180 TaxID=3346761 RepID=UPI0036D0A67C